MADEGVVRNWVPSLLGTHSHAKENFDRKECAHIVLEISYSNTLGPSPIRVPLTLAFNKIAVGQIGIHCHFVTMISSLDTTDAATVSYPIECL